MPKFFVGDKVRRIVSDYYYSGCPFPGPSIGDLGTVSSVRDTWIGLKEFPQRDDKEPYDFHLFELVEADTSSFTPAAIPKTAAKGTNPKDILGIKKVQLNLVPPSSTIYEALAMEDGAKKYGPFNWRNNNVLASIYVAAAKRHLDEWFDGQELTNDTGVPNLGAAKACIGIIIDALENGNLVDDRPPPGPATRLIERLAAEKQKKKETK